MPHTVGEEDLEEAVRTAAAEVAHKVRHTAVEAVGREEKEVAVGYNRLAEEADIAVGHSHEEAAEEEDAGRTAAVHPVGDSYPVEEEIAGNIPPVGEEDIVGGRSFVEGEAARMEVDNRPEEGMAAARSLGVAAALWIGQR